MNGGNILSTVYLIRHGETDFSQKNIVQGQKDVPINSTGLKTIVRISDYISEHIIVKKVFTSDLLRCMQTCEIITNKLSNRVECVTSKWLREISLGVFEGQSMDKLEFYRESFGDYNSFVPDGGESFNQLINRVQGWFFLNYSILGDSLIISHRGPISIIVENALNSTDFDMNDILKQGRVVVLKLFKEKKYIIDNIIIV